MDPRNHVFGWGTYWHHVAYVMNRSCSGGGVTCHFHYCGNLFVYLSFLFTLFLFFYYSVVHRFISRFLSVIHVLFFFCRLHLFYYAFTHHTIGPEALCFFGCLSVFMRKYVCASLQMGPPDALCFWVVSPSVHAQAEAFSDRFVVGF